MKKEIIKDIIVEALNHFYRSQKLTIEADEHTEIVGENSKVDSLSLVNLMVEIETKFIELNHEITLASDTALTHADTPMARVSTLVDYIYDQLEREAGSKRSVYGAASV